MQKKNRVSITSSDALLANLYVLYVAATWHHTKRVLEFAATPASTLGCATSLMCEHQVITRNVYVGNHNAVAQCNAI